MIDALLAGLLGLLIGSFLNVCIYRLPRDLSVVRPRSHCIACHYQISWYDNIPLLSYFLLRGRCRNCGVRISPRYPLVELLTGALFFASVALFGWTLAGLKACIFDTLLIGLFFADLEERILPDEFTLGGTLIGLVLAFFVPLDDITAHAILWMAGVDLPARWASPAEAVLGAVLPALFLWIGGELYYRIRHREGLGFGDVKLMAMVGSFLGLRGALLTLIVGSVLGSLIGYGYILATRKDPSSYELPFGTFLAAAAIFVALAGAPVMRWYAGMY